MCSVLDTLLWTVGFGVRQIAGQGSLVSEQSLLSKPWNHIYSKFRPQQGIVVGPHSWRPTADPHGDLEVKSGRQTYNKVMGQGWEKGVSRSGRLSCELSQTPGTQVDGQGRETRYVKENSRGQGTRRTYLLPDPNRVSRGVSGTLPRKD